MHCGQAWARERGRTWTFLAVSSHAAIMFGGLWLYIRVSVGSRLRVTKLLVSNCNTNLNFTLIRTLNLS